MSAKRRSEAWSYFSQKRGNRVKCLYCGRFISIANKSTNNLWRHIKSLHQFDPEPEAPRTPSCATAEEIPDILGVATTAVMDDKDSSEHSVEDDKKSKSSPNIDKLIELVKGNEELYNARNENFKNLKRRQELWENIAKTLNYESVADAKRDWKNLKGGYTKAKKRTATKNGTGRIHSKVRKYMDQMAFLDDCDESAENGDYSSDNIQGGQREAVVEEVTIVNTNLEDDISEFVTIINKHGETVPTSTSNDFDLNEKTNTPGENDDLRSFFINMFETSKKFSRERQRSLKRQIFTIVSDMEDDQESESKSLGLSVQNAS